MYFGIAITESRRLHVHTNSDGSDKTLQANLSLLCARMFLSIQDLLYYSPTNILSDRYSLIQTKCQGGNKYALPITVKFDQSTRKCGRISLHACSS